MKIFIFACLWATVGQGVWAVIFWNSPLFVYHWHVGMLALIPAIISVPFIVKEIKKNLRWK